MVMVKTFKTLNAVIMNQKPKLGDYEFTGRTTKKDGITTTTTNVFPGSGARKRTKTRCA